MAVVFGEGGVIWGGWLDVSIAVILKRRGRAKPRPRKTPYLNNKNRRKLMEHCRAEKALRRDNRKVC